MTWCHWMNLETSRNTNTARTMGMDGGPKAVGSAPPMLHPSGCRGGSVCPPSSRRFLCQPHQHWRWDHMYTTIQLPRNGCRRLSHQSPSLGPARPGPASPNKTIKTTTTTQSSSFNALTVTSAHDSAGGVPNPGAAGDPLSPRRFCPAGVSPGSWGLPTPLCPPAQHARTCSSTL